MPTPIKRTLCNKGVLQNCDPPAANRGASLFQILSLFVLWWGISKG